MSSFTISTGRSSFRQNFKTTVMKILGESVSHLFDEWQQSLAVALPLERKFTFMWKLVTAQEDGQLEAVGVQVAEVIHTCERGSQVEDKECRLLFPPLNFYPHCVNTYCPPLASSWLCWRFPVPQWHHHHGRSPGRSPSWTDDCERMTSPTIETWRRRASPSELLRSAAECEPTSPRSSRRFLSTAGCRSTATTSRIMGFFMLMYACWLFMCLFFVKQPYRYWWTLHVKRVSDQFLSSLQISSQHKGVALHPGNDGFCLSGELWEQETEKY